MNKIEIVNSPIVEPNKHNLWLKGGSLKYFGANGWQNIQSETQYATAHLNQDDVDIDIKLPIASETQVGGVRIMDSDHSHLIVSKEGNLYVDTSDDYMDNNPNKVATIAAVTSLYMDTHGEKDYAKLDKYGIVKQAKYVGPTQTESVGAINTKLNNLINQLIEAGIMADK